MVGLGQLGWNAANGVAYKLIEPAFPEYAQEAYGANLNRLQQVGLNATGGANIGGAERFTYTLTQILLPAGIAKGATLGRVSRAADAADVARLEAAVVTEANAQCAASFAGEAAEVRTVVTEATADSGVQGVTAQSPCLATEGTGLNWVTSIEKGSRPHPSTYLSVAERNAHAAAFEDGASRFMIKQNFDRWGIGREDGSSFVMTRSEADQLWTKADGNARVIEDAIGLEPGFLKDNQLIRVDIPRPEKFNLRIPSGNEAGANTKWISGGKGPDGYFEGVIDAGLMKPGDYFWHELNF